MPLNSPTEHIPGFEYRATDAFCCCGFPLVKPLPSIPSAAGWPALFEDFTGTTGLSDFPS
jgi:hypothetical protein